MATLRRSSESSIASVSRVYREQVQIIQLTVWAACPSVFKVADISQRNLVSWEDFVVFESCELVAIAEPEGLAALMTDPLPLS
jgi:hypothetical protein